MFVNKLKMNSVAEAVKEITEKDDSCKDEVKKHEKRLHGKDGEVSKHVDKMHKEESELDEAEKVMTSTGMRVYGSSYGNSAKARRDQVKKDIDTLKGPKSKDLMQKDKEDYMKTKGQYDEAAKPDFLDMDKDGDKKEPMKKAVADKKMKEDTEFKDKLIEALKGNQHKIDKNKNNKIDAQDFKILRKEESEELDEKEMTDSEMAKREKIVKSMKKGFAGFRQRYGKDAKSVMYATATKQAMKEDAVEEEIDPKVRTKDTLKGQERTAQSDDVGPNSNGRSTKVKFHGGPMKEEVKKSDIPAFIRKARGDKPLTVADVKSPRKDSISSKENLAKARGVQEGKHPESDTVPFVTNAEQPPFDGPYKKIGGTVTDKSGAKHTPMSRAKDLARQAMKRIKTEMLGKAPGNNG
jgi:predicted secreted protein